MATQTTTNGSSITIKEEVEAIQSELRARLTGALASPPADIPPESLPTVPLIDLSPSFAPNPLSSRQAVASQIRDACLKTGFFQISNHGVSEKAMDGILKQAERFFSTLTPAQKDAMHIRHSAITKGYESGGDTYVNPDDSTGGNTTNEFAGETETKEAFNFSYEPSLDPTGGDGKYVEIDGKPALDTNTDTDLEPGKRRKNQWPLESDLPGFRSGVAEYYAQILNLARHLFKLFALSLGLQEDYFAPLTTHPGGIMRLLHYPPQSAESLSKRKGKLGLGAHTDYECFTLLLCSTNPGLEILFPPTPQTHNRPVWLPCPLRPGTLTVNVADFLMRWTNGLYKSTIHRVVSRGDVDGRGSEARYSVPLFFSINYDAEVEALPEEVVGVSRFQKMRAGEYVLERLSATTVHTNA